ncbi:MAG: TPM domain-containing protein [Flavobacteriales bacterium]
MKRSLLLALLMLSCCALWAQDDCLPAKPADETHLVWQFTPLLDQAEAQQLDTKLAAFAQRTSNRIAVIIVDTLCGLEPVDYAVAIGRAWGIGGAEFNNGVVLLVKPNGGKGRRHVFIAPGHGLEGAIPDLACKRIVEEELLPQFKEGRYAQGLDDAVNTLMELAEGEISAESYSKPSLPWVPIVGVILFIVLIISLKVGQTRRYARVNNIDFWVAWTLLNQATRSSRGSWGGFTGGGGGGGGGGFGGFGGGSFGGGGAGGSW